MADDKKVETLKASGSGSNARRSRSPLEVDSAQSMEIRRFYNMWRPFATKFERAIQADSTGRTPHKKAVLILITTLESTGYTLYINGVEFSISTCTDLNWLHTDPSSHFNYTYTFKVSKQIYQLSYRRAQNKESVAPTAGTRTVSLSKMYGNIAEQTVSITNQMRDLNSNGKVEYMVSRFFQNCVKLFEIADTDDDNDDDDEENLWEARHL